MTNKTDKAIGVKEPSLRQAISAVAVLFEQAEMFFGHGTDNAQDEAAWLVISVAGLCHDLPDSTYAQLLSHKQQKKINALAQLRIQSRQPLAYLLHEAWFCGVKFYVDERVLVPRSPLAELIMRGFEPWQAGRAVTAVLDIGTGSACIAIACALAFPAAQIDAADISVAALAVAEINIKNHKLQARVHAIESDLFAALDGRRYDIIISNPPYVDNEDLATMPVEFSHEPVLGLASGADGLDHARQILKQAGSYLKPNGLLVVEVGNSAEAMSEAFPHISFTWLSFGEGGHGVFLLSREELMSVVV